MTIDGSTSEKLKVLSFVCSVLVVIQHSYAQATFLQSFVTQSLTRLAVPFFFIVSGLLLYRDFEFSMMWAMSKVFTRCKTLLVPYFSWAAIALLLSTGEGGLDNILKVVGITSSSPYGAGHLWYVRTLFLFVLASLPLAMVLKSLRWLVPIGALLLFSVCLRGANCFSMCYFSIGALVALFHPAILHRKLPVWCLPLLGGIGLFLLLLRTFVFRGMIEISFPIPVFRRLTEFLMVLVLLPAVWRVCDFVEESLVYKKVSRLAHSAFFVYCLHPFVYQFLPPDGFWLFRVIGTVFVCEVVYWALRHVCPSSLIFLSGGR